MRFNYEEETTTYFLTLEINGHKYVYLYEKEFVDQIKMRILKDAANPELNINIYYARLLIEKLKGLKYGEEERSESNDEPLGGNERNQQRY